MKLYTILTFIFASLLSLQVAYATTKSKEPSMKFAYLYAMPGYEKPQIDVIKTDKATFYAVAIDITKKETAASVARKLWQEEKIQMIELCGGLADALIVAKVKDAVENKIPVGAVFYGPESRRPLVDLLNL